MKRAFLFVATAVGLWACEAPPVFPGADKRQNTNTAHIEGEVVVSSAARGKVVLFLYDAARPPPPVGTGRPLAFTVVAREQLFGKASDGDLGPFTAPYAFSLVPVGQYLIRGFIDADEDFIPWYGVTSDVTQGDVGGAAVDPVTKVPRVISVGEDESGKPVAAVNVPVSFSDAARLPLDRPAFAVSGDLETLIISSEAKVIDLRLESFDLGLVAQPSPGFLLRFVDDDGDGTPDDANGDGRPDLWPRVVVRKLSADSVLVDENDLDRNGIIDADGVDHDLASSGQPDGNPDAVVLAAGFDPTEYASQLFDGMGKVKPTPTLVTHLKLAIQPRAFDVSTPTRPLLLKTVPSGRYAITVIQQTGQTWRMPNELSPSIATVVGLPELASQRFVIEVP